MSESFLEAWNDESLIEELADVVRKGKNSDGSSHISRTILKEVLKLGNSVGERFEEFRAQAGRFDKRLLSAERKNRLQTLFVKLQRQPKPHNSSGDDLRDPNNAFDRSFYGVEEEDSPNLSGKFLGSEDKWKRREDKLVSSVQGSLKKGTARLHEESRNRDRDVWEDNLMYRSGVKSGRTYETNESGRAEDAEKVHIVVHNVRPTFLSRDDKVKSLDNISDTCKVVLDEKSDIARAAAKGSAAVLRVREKILRTKMTHKFWELGGSRIGNVMGVASDADYGQSDELHRERRDLDKIVKTEDGSGPDPAPKRLLQNARKRLPVFRVRDELMRCIRNNQVVVIVGETGSGKTTQLTQYLREEGYTGHSLGLRKTMIGCTQPRRVAAMSVAKRVAEEVGCKLGQTVGYSIRFEDCTSDETEIKYMTDGVLMRESLSAPDLDQYSCVVMDEAHERSLYTDVLFGILKGVVARRLDFKLIVTSATLDADRFAHFFGRAATFRVPGRTFRVDNFYSKVPVVDYVEAAARKALEIHLGSGPGDILIFMTGQEDISAACELIAERISALTGEDGESTVPGLLLLPMYSQLPSDMQAQIFEKTADGRRKCIVSTNIAETSLTVDGIKYVIDSGFCKLKVFNPRVGMDTLRVTPISQANANQRSGRAGRTAEGFCWRLYTSNQYAREMFSGQVPEIQRTNLENVVLLLKSLGVKDLLMFDFMDSPPRENIINSMYHLWVLGALDDTGELTNLGKRMGALPCDPPLAKMLIYAEDLGCQSEILTIVSMLSVPEVFYRPSERAEESDTARERFFVPESDHLTLLNVFNLVQRHNFSPAWCAKHFIQLKSVIKAKDVRVQLSDLCSKRGDGIDSGGDVDSQSRKEARPYVSWDVTRKAICSAYFIHAAKLKNVTSYVNLLTGTPFNLHPSSALCGIGETPDYVVYHELVLTSKEYMRTVTAIDPLWLTEMGPMFFSEKGASKRRHEEAKSFAQGGGLGSATLSDTKSSARVNFSTAKPSVAVNLDRIIGVEKKKKRKMRGL